MAPIHSRQLLVWTLPTIAVLLSYLWYKKKRIGAQSDPGDDDCSSTNTIKELKLKQEEAKVLLVAAKESPCCTPGKSYNRSLSGVESTPIDIVIPSKLRGSRSTPIVISDEDLDLEIEKIKSMRNGPLFSSKETESPIKQQQKQQASNSLSPAKDCSNNSIGSGSSNKKLKIKKNKKGSATVEKMAQKDINVVEEKLNSMKLNNNNNSNNNNNKEVVNKKEQKNNKNNSLERKSDHDLLHRQSSERDSANHSPSDTMMASPSLSSISDNHSEGSNDSGKGGSDMATPPPSRTPPSIVEDTDSTITATTSTTTNSTNTTTTTTNNMSTIYEFFIPQSLVGKLIGRHGSSITQIKDRTNVMIIVKKHPTNNKLKICSLEGTKKEIEHALKMLRDKFPIKRYPEVTLEQVHMPAVVSTIPLIPDHLYLKLIEGINNDTIVSCMVSPNHLFLQQPTHPSFPSLNLLTNYMNICYTETESPLLPNPIPENTVCAAYSVNSWYRAMVLSTDTESDMSYVKFLDYGGFAYVDNDKLRQIRADFMLLPFQAAECMLANIKSLSEDGAWPEEAYNLVADITKGAIIYTQVADYTEDGVPLVLCYVVIGTSSVVFLNQHLVDNGFAEWITTEAELEQIEASTTTIPTSANLDCASTTIQVQ